MAKRGDLHALQHLNAAAIERLIDVGAVARIAAPPLTVLRLTSTNAWANHAAKLAKAGIVDAEQFLESDPERIAETLRVKVETAQQYLDEVRALLIAPLP